MYNSSTHKRWQFKTLSWFAVLLLTFFFIPVTGSLTTSAAENLALEANLVGRSIELKLTNSSAQAVTVKGPIDVAVTVNGTGFTFPRESLSTTAGDVILGGSTSMTIAAGATDTIAVIAPGLPDTWRPNESSNHKLIIDLWLNIDNLDTRLSPVEITVTQVAFNPGLELKTNSPVPYGDTPPNIDLILKNTSGQAITIKGPVVVQGTDHWSIEAGEERLRFNLLSGNTMTIAAGAEVKVAEVEPGPPHSWRMFYNPKTLPVTAWVEVTSSAVGTGIWQSETVEFGITGTLEVDLMHGEVKKVEDNGDGTASVYVTIYKGAYQTSVTAKADGTFDSSSKSVEYPDQPITAMAKDNFAIWQKDTGGAYKEFANIQRVFEPSPGTYRLIVEAADGTHKNIVLEGERPSEDLFGVFANDIELTVSTLNRAISSVKDAASDKYVGTLSYPSVNLTFTSSEEITATINLRQKNSTARPIPDNDLTPTGLFFDINIADGEFIDTEILMEISYTRDDIPVGMNEANLKIFRYNETTETWDLLPNQEIDTDRKVISVVLTGFSEFGIFEYDVPLAEAPEAEEPATEPAEEETAAPTTDDTSDAIVDNPPTGQTTNWPMNIAMTIMIASSILLLSVKPWRKNTNQD